MFREGSRVALLRLAVFASVTSTIAISGCNNRSRSAEPDGKTPASSSRVKTQGEPTEPLSNQEATVGGETQAQPGQISVDLGHGVKLTMVPIVAGEFLMGSPDSDDNASDDEKPRHRVRITKPFYLGKFLVTQEQWEAVTKSNPSNVQGPKTPVVNVSWDDCRRFCDMLNAKPHPAAGKFQLPTEAQWEYACRAGSTRNYCFDNEESRLGEYAWYAGNSQLRRASCRREEAECLGSVRHAWERLGVVPGLV